MTDNSLFSQRNGYRPSQKALQRDSVDQELRNRLWTVFDRCYWSPWRSKHGNMAGAPLKNILLAYWTDHLKRASIDFPEIEPVCLGNLHSYFVTTKWWGVYDFIEFLLANRHLLPDHRPADGALSVNLVKFIRQCNEVLAEENAAFRIHATRVVPLTDERGLEELEIALRAAEPFPTVTGHLNKATDLLAVRNQTAIGYLECVHESINAVRALCNAAAGTEHATLDEALTAFEQAFSLHPDLKEGIICMFGDSREARSGWSRDADGKAMMTLTDARFVLVSCAATVNYLITRMEDAKPAPHPQRQDDL
jgi:hypothetical protein